jgi:hypothetical protein
MEGAQRPVHPWVAEGARRVRFGIDLGPFPTFAATIEWAQAIEELGYNSFLAARPPGARVGGPLHLPRGDRRWSRGASGWARLWRACSSATRCCWRGSRPTLTD